MKYELVNQSDFADRLNVTRQYIGQLIKRKECPFDYQTIAGKHFIMLTEKTQKFMEKTINNQKRKEGIK